MSKTFLSFRLKHVIRSCAFVLAVLFVLNGETSRAQTPMLARHVVDTTVCALGTTSIDLGPLLHYTDAAGQREIFTVLTGPMGTTPIVGAGVGTLTGFADTVIAPAGIPTGMTKYNYVTNTSSGGRTFTIMVTNAVGNWDTMRFNVSIVNTAPIAAITGAYNEVHVGQSITFTGSNTANAFYSGPSTSSWSFTPAGLTTMTASGSTVTLSGTAQGTGTLTLTETGTCGTGTDTRSIAILTNTPPSLTATLGAAMIQGQSYTISGSSFDPTPGRYSVYFGAAKVASTITATSSTITVTVPKGATYAPIYVLDNVSHLSSFIMPSFTPLYDSTHLISSTYTNVKTMPALSPSPGVGATGGTPYSVEYADFDGDGKNDIVVCGTGSQNAIVFKNTSGGPGLVSFANPDSFKTSGGPISVRVADMDGDGKLDIVTANAGGRSVSILRNTSVSGTISFAPRVDVFLPGLLPVELAIADFNKDGRPDIAVLMLGVASDDGTYFTPGTYTADERSGRLVIVRNNYNKSINNALAVTDFDTATIHQYDVASAPISVAAADVNEDGGVDIVVSNHHRREIDIYRNASTVSSTNMPTFPTVTHVSTAAGAGSLAAYDPTSSTITGRSYDYTQYRTGYPNQLKIGDLNGDGHVDLAVAVTDSDLLSNNEYNKIEIFRNNTTGGFATTDTILLNTNGASPVALVLADLSGDNLLDIVNSNAGAGNIAILRNRGTGLGFEPAVTKPTAIGPVCVAVGDLDNNTVFDIAVVTRQSNKLQIFRGYPLPDTTAIIGDSVICSTSTNNRYNSSRGPGAGATAYWSTFGGHISIAGVNTNDTVYINAGPTAGTDTLYYNVIRLNDTNTVKYVVRVNATAATPAVLTGADSVCVGSSITLTSNSPGTWAVTPASVATITSGGVLTGSTGGTATVTFTLSGCTSTTTTKTITVSTPLTPSAITGLTRVCQGSTITLSATVPTGGTLSWSAAAPSISTVSAPTTTGSTSTVTVSGLTVGNNIISYTVTNVCGSFSSTKADTVSITPVAGPLSGSHVMCASSSQTLTGATAGGTWTSSATGIASVNATTGVVTSGAGTGVADITYTVTGCTTVSDTFRINVSAAPAVGTISGPTHQCAGSTISLSYTGTAGTWSATSGLTLSATTGSPINVLAGATAGVDTVYYTVSSVGCPSVVTKHIDTVISISTITPITSSAGTGADTICINGTVTFSNATSPGTWSLSNTTVATINPTGGSVLVTGLVSGSDTVIYTATGCGTLSTKRPVYVRATPSAGTISGVNSICAAVPGFATLATTGTPGGVWGSSNTSTATVDASGTVVSTSTTTAGANPVHTTNITYSVTTLVCGSGTTDANYSFTVTTAPVVSSITTTLLPGGTTLSDSVCIGAQLRGNATPNAGGVTTLWSVSNGNLTITGSPTTTPATFNGVASGTTVIKFKATNTCGSDSLSKPIKIKTIPSAGHIVGDTAVCLPNSGITYIDTVGSTQAVGGTWGYVGSGSIFITPSGPTAGEVTFGGGSAVGVITYTTANNGCGTNSTSINLVVNNAPNAGVTSAPSGTSICVGEMDTLTNTEFATGGGYQWYSKDVTIATVNQAGIVTGTGAGSVKIYYIDSTGCGVDSTSFVTITVGGLAPVGVITGQDTACVGGTVQLLNTAVPGGVWSSSAPSIASINATTGLVTAGPNGGTAIITYTTSNGTCPDNDTTFTFRSFAAPNFHSTAPATICDSQLLSFVGTSDTVGSTFTWTRAAVTGIFNAAASGIDTVREYLDDTTNTAVTATYAFIATAHGCVSNPYNVNVSVTPTPHLTSPLFDTICSGALFVYVAQASTTPASLAWTRPTVAGISNSVGNGTTGTISETLNDTTVASVTVQYIYTVGYGTCPTHTETLTVSVNPSPAVPKIVTHSPSTVCSMTMDQNFGAASTPPAGVIYTWFATGAQVWATGSDRQYSLVNFTEPGDAVVYLLATVPGLSCPAKDSFPVSVSSSVSDQPQVAYFNGDFICLSSNQDTYQWGYDNRSTLDSSLFTSETNQNMTVENPDFTGKYYFVITTHNGCMQKSYYNAPTGVKNITGSMGDMKVYPNPADQFVNVEINNTAGGKYNVEVVNLLGQKLDAKEMVNNKANLDIANLASGVYMINCYRDGVKFASAKFVKN